MRFIIVLEWIQNVKRSCSILWILEVLTVLPKFTVSTLSILVDVVIEQRILAEVNTVEGWVGIDTLLLLDPYQALIVLLVFLINLLRVHHPRLVAPSQLLHFSYLFNFALLCVGPLSGLFVLLFNHLTHCPLLGHYQRFLHGFRVYYCTRFLRAYLTALWLQLVILRPWVLVRLEALLTLDKQIVYWLQLGLR